MTRPGTAAPFPAASLEAAADELRRRGRRLSAARRAVLQTLFAATGPVSAEQIAAGLGGRFPRAELTSVYRNLETLEHEGLVRHVHLGHGPGRYVLADAVSEFLLCEICGSVEAVDPQRLDAARAAIRAELGFDARFTHLPISGTCGRCAGRGG